jgi:ABC-2 type transport system ATP-binding protein
VHAVQDISFGVDTGTIFGLLGPNGAGKTTTIGVLAGLVKPSSGSAFVGGFDVVKQSQQAKHVLGFVPQDIVLYEDLNARENLEFFGGLYGIRGAALRARIDELLSLTDLVDAARRPAQTYSGGMKRRLNMACGLVHKPSVLLLDEPTVGIDPQARLHILEMVRRIATEGTTILYTTHYLHEAEDLCRRIAIIDHGKILAEGTLDELRAQVGERDLVTVRGRFDVAAARAAVARVAGLDTVKVDEDEIVVATPHAADALRQLTQALAPAGETREFSVRQPSLENLFIKLTGRELRE